MLQHRLHVSPCCGSQLRRYQRASGNAIIEDVPQEITRIRRRAPWCRRDFSPAYKEHVEPIVGESPVPNATLKNNIVALTSRFRFGLGINDLAGADGFLASHLRTPVSAGGLLDI